MGQITEYPLNESPGDDDQVLGVDDPDGDWAVQRFSVGALLASVRARLEQMEIALNENGIYPGEIVFHTSGVTFAPVIVLYGGSTATVEWTFSDGSTSSSLTPNVSFGTAGTRVQRLKVTPWSDVYRINVGYDASDGGALDIEQIPQQNVTSIENLHLVAGTLVDFCGNNTPITTMDFSNFLSLDTIELYGANLVAINIYNTPVLQRLQVESTSLAELDMSTSPSLGDIRASSNPYTYVNFGDGLFDNLWHICMRDTAGSYVINYPIPSNMPNIQDLLIWDTNQSGVGSFTGLTALRNANFHDNGFTSLDFTGSFSNFDGGERLDVYDNNNLTNLVITGCTDLDYVDASNCALTQSAVDHVLATLDANGLSGGTVDLSGGTNAAPSISGLAAQTSLSGKGWTVTLNEPDVPMLSSATIGADGDTWTLVFTEAVNIGTGGSGGFAVTMNDAGAVALTYSSGEGSNTLIYTGDVTVQAGDTVASGLDYTQPGDGIENTTGFDLESFTDESVTNNSIVGPPVLLSATIGADGDTWTLVFSKAVNIGSGGSGGFAVTMVSAGAISLTYSSGDGSDTLVYSGDTTVNSGDTVSSGLDYTQPGNGIEDDGGFDLESFTGESVTNNSTQGTSSSIALVSYGDDYMYGAGSVETLTTGDITFSSGDVAVACCQGWDVTMPDSLTDSLGNTWQKAGDDQSVTMMRMAWFTCVVNNPGTGNVTWDNINDNFVSLGVLVFSGIDTSDPIGTLPTSVAGSGGTLNMSTTNPNEVIIVAQHDDGAPAVSYTPIPAELSIVIDTLDSGANQGRPMGYWIPGSAQTNTPVGMTPQAGNLYSITAMSLVGAAQ